MKKPGLIFAFVAVYAITAFAWWTIAHIRSSDLLYEKGRENLELLCYKANVEINGAIQQELFKDTIGAKEFASFNFPELEVIFIDPEMQINPLNQFLIRPKKASYLALEKRHSRNTLMYSLEGLVMVLLLIWGIIWIYQSLQSRLSFNKQQNNFMLSITHELKTPLASVKLYIETLLKRNLDKEQSENILRSSLSELVRLKDLVNNILLAAQLENKKFELYETEIDLGKLTEEAIQKFATPRGMSDRIISHIAENVFIEGDSIATETVINNLISNAAKYSPEMGKIEVVVKQQGESVLLSISDEGQGISDADKKSLFKKFYRGGDEQTRKTKGTGLGLFIVKNLLQLMKAEIHVKNNLPKGTIFEIIFKQANAI